MGACDGRTQGGFNWSLQRLVMEVVRDGCGRASEGGRGGARSGLVAGSAVGGAAGGAGAVFAGDSGPRLAPRCPGRLRAGPRGLWGGGARPEAEGPQIRRSP